MGGGGLAVGPLHGRGKPLGREPRKMLGILAALPFCEGVCVSVSVEGDFTPPPSYPAAPCFGERRVLEEPSQAWLWEGGGLLFSLSRRTTLI